MIRLPASVPPVVYQSFLSLTPLFFLVRRSGCSGSSLGVDIDRVVQAAFAPLVFALNTLPGILVYALLVTLLWSVGINGDNAVDAIVAPDLPAVSRRQRRGHDRRPAAAVRDGLRLLHHVRECRRHRRHDRAGAGAVELEGPGLPEGQPPVAADAGLSDQRADLLRPADRAQSDLHDAVRPQRADPDDRQLPADALGRHPQAVRQRAVDDAADHRALPGDGRRLEGRGLGGGLDRDRDDGVLSVRQGRGTPAARRPRIRGPTHGDAHPHAFAHVWSLLLWSFAQRWRRRRRQSAPETLPAEGAHVPHRRGVRARHGREGARSIAASIRRSTRRCTRPTCSCPTRRSPSSRPRPAPAIWIGTPRGRRPPEPATSGLASTSPASAGCPTITSPGSASTEKRRGSRRRRLCADRGRADDAGRQVPRVRRSRAGAPQPLGTHRRFAPARSRATSRPTRWSRATTTDCGRRCTSPPNASASR